MNYFRVGKIVNTHGIKGEVKVLPISDFADLRLNIGNKVSLFLPDGTFQQSMEITGKRLHKGMFLLTFRGIDTMTDAEKFKQMEIKISEQQLHTLPEGEYYYHEIIGCTAVTDTGQTLGVIDSILTPGANHVWVVADQQGREILLPVIDDVILQVDVANKRVLVHLLDGLVE